MQIVGIKVVNLYGLHHYDILLDRKECLKIIHAPNGYGKTTILRLIKDILEGDYRAIYAVPFESFTMIFDNQDELKILKNEQLLVYCFTGHGEQETYEVSRNQSSDELIYLEKRLQKIHQEMPIYLIDASRLWIEKRNDGDEASSFLPTVLEYARELSEWMREALAEANYCGQERDRSFPVRLIESIQNQSEPYLNLQEIEVALRELEETRMILQQAGLYTKATHEMSYALEEGDQSNEMMCKVLTLYIADSKEKLKPFEGLAAKIHLLCELINKRFSYKVMEVTMKEGFVFKTPNQERLKADKLSSGEQNQLILMFKLLFKSPNNAMILMDEPEISLHIAWQQSFLEDMEAIAKLSNIRMMIATHSPDIINGRWDLTSGLEEASCEPI